MNFARAIGCDDDDGRLGRFDRADFGNSDLEIAEQFEQERFELLIGPVEFVNQQHRRRPSCVSSIA